MTATRLPPPTVLGSKCFPASHCAHLTLRLHSPLHLPFISTTKRSPHSPRALPPTATAAVARPQQDPGRRLCQRRRHRLLLHLRHKVQRRELHRQAHGARPAVHGARSAGVLRCVEAVLCVWLEAVLCVWIEALCVWCLHVSVRECEMVQPVKCSAFAAGPVCTFGVSGARVLS